MKNKKMSLFGKIRDHSFFFIGLIIFSFIFNPKTLLNFFSFHAVFKIDGKKLQNFLKLKKKLYPTSLYDKILPKIKEEKHIIQSAKKIGIQFMNKDFWNFLYKKSLYKHITQYKKKEGSFNTKKFKYYLLNSGKIKNHGFVWFQQKQNIHDQILIHQYLDMCLCGLNTKKSFISKSKIVDYLYKKKQKIRADEIADYMKANSFFSNLGDIEFFFINFARKFSKMDSEIRKKQMESLFFEFKKETKYLINYHSDVSYNPIYYSYNFFPYFLRNLLKNSKRVSFLTRKNYYLLAKITGKKMIYDSIRASHIFIDHKGSFSNTFFYSKKRRSIKESIKKINELFFILKKKPKLFKALVKKESFKNNGYLGLGWIDIGGIKKTSDFQNFLIENPKGKIGVFETPIGYHIIRIDDKSPLRPFYKLSIFLKYINSSKKTDKTQNQRVKEFIQENGKANFSFCAKNARKKGSQVKTKIDSTILDLYSEIIQWSFDKKRKLGEFKVFLNSSYIIARISSLSRVSVKNEVKKIIKNKKIAKNFKK
ncbi:MAG TPA: peptidylprolyl isomerase [Blattabacteriaceae bacterium]